MFMLGLNETINQLAMVNSVQWYGCVLRREDGLVWRVLKYEVRQVYCSMMEFTSHT